MTVTLLCALGLVAMVTAAPEDVRHGTPIKHGKQDPITDGHHNVHFDHEAILGQYHHLRPYLFNFLN